MLGLDKAVIPPQITSAQQPADEARQTNNR
jgi:hypothetical protein